MLSQTDFDNKKLVVIRAKTDSMRKLKFVNENIEIWDDENHKLNKVSSHIIFAVFIVGECTLTSKLIREFKDRGISLFLLNNRFKPVSEIVSIAEGNFLLRMKQYGMGEEKELKMAKILALNKMENQIDLLEEYRKYDYTTMRYDARSPLLTSNDFYSLQGTEGYIASHYFSFIFAEQGWRRRAPTAKEDIINFLMDIGYSMLFNLTDACLRLFGFDTYKGFYHKLFYQRKSLNCDIMELFRIWVDKAILKAYNLKIVNEKDFSYYDGYYHFKKGDSSFKYIKLFTDMLTENKDKLYRYCTEFYRYVSNPDKYEFPIYSYAK